MNKTAFIFPGQGSQYVGMGADLYERYPRAKAVFDAADSALGFSLTDLCFSGTEEDLKQTENTQVALLTMSVACYEVVREYLPAPAYMAGHSLGEYSALVASGALEFGQALLLVRERGRLMGEAGAKVPGSMAAIIALDLDTLLDVCAETGAYVANINCPGQIVISGEPDKVKAASKLARERGAKLAIPLQVSGAFHSPLMKSASDVLAPKLATLEVKKPQVPVIGNIQAQPLVSTEDVRSELMAQICGCVRWEQSVERMVSQGTDTFIELGPGKVLSGLVSHIAPDALCKTIGKVEDVEGLKA